MSVISEAHESTKMFINSLIQIPPSWKMYKYEEVSAESCPLANG